MALRPLLIFIWVLLTPILRVTSEQDFETAEPDTRIVQRCKGSNLTLYEPDDEVTVLHVFVFLGRESLASSSVPATGMFEKRLTVHNNGRVTLTNLTSDDLGTYRVEVKAEDKITHTITLIIKEPPRSADGKLFVMKNALSDTNSIRLMCGAFTTLGFPPVSAVWKDPAGRTLSSDGFKDEYFYLDVPADTADSGDYCCQLDCRAPDFCCLDDQSPIRSCATIPVHTDRKVEVTTDHKMSSGNVTQAMAYLVHRQARCDQLDTYITKVETLQVDMLKGIETRASDQVKDLQQRMEEISEAADKHQSQLYKQIIELAAEGKTGLSGLQQITTDLRTTLTSNVQTMTNLTSKTELRVSELEKKLSTIHNTLNRLEKNTNELLEAIRSNMSAISKVTLQDKCRLKAGYMWHLKACFKLSTREVNYSTAKAKCEADGAHLYDVKSPVLDEERVRFALNKAENCVQYALKVRRTPSIFVIGVSGDPFKLWRRTDTKLGISSSFTEIWVGGNDLKVEGDFRWSDGTPLSSSSKLWDEDQPNDNYGAEDCVIIYFTSLKFVLYDRRCYLSYRYLCQYEL